MKKIISIVLAATGAFSAFALPTMPEGWKLLNSGKCAEAEKVFREIAADAKEGYNGTIGLMFTLRRQRKNEDVVKEVDSWLEKNPQATINQKSHLLVFKGNALRDLQKYDEAFATYKSGVDMKSTNSNSSDCAKEYIALAVNIAKYDLAVAMYEQESKNPVAMNNVGFLVNAAQMCWKTNKGEEGLKLIAKAEKIKAPEWIKEHIYRVRGYLMRDCLKDFEGAVKAFEQALALPSLTESQKAVLWNNIGIAYEKDEEYEKAVEAYKKVGTFKTTGWFMRSAANSAIRLQKKIDAGE